MNNACMKQEDLGLELSTRRTRKQILLEEMEQVMPWAERLVLILPHAPVVKTGRPPFNLEVVLHIHYLQQWFGLSDLGTEEPLFEIGFCRDFVGISGAERIPDRVSILRFRHLLEEHDLSPRVLQSHEGQVRRARPAALEPRQAPGAGQANSVGRELGKAKRLKASIRSKVDHPFRVIKRQFGYTKVRYHGLDRNTTRLITLLVLSNVWMARRRLLQGGAGVSASAMGPKAAKQGVNALDETPHSLGQRTRARVGVYSHRAIQTDNRPPPSWS